jgi:hypothetical protein
MSSTTAPPCPHHPDARAEAACTSCGRPLCAECWAFDVNDAPWCRHCVDHIHDRSPAAFPLAFLGGTGTLLAAFYVRFRQVDDAVWVALGVAVTLLATAGFLYRRSSQVFGNHKMVERPRSVGRPHPEALGAYRSAPRRARMGSIVPPVSGKLSTLVVLLCLMLPLAVLPGLLSVPVWLAVDSVLALWWLTLVSAFAVLLYRGARLADDGPTLGDARPLEAEAQAKAEAQGTPTATSKKSPLDSCGGGCDGGCSGLGSIGGEGLGAALGALLALGLLLLLSWLLAEFVLPLLFTAAYYVVSRGLRRVANDTHDCQGDLPRAMGWSVAWATLYTLPFALVVFLAQGLIAASR